MPTAPTIDDKIIGLAKRTITINKQLQTLIQKNRNFNQSLNIIKSREEPVLDENGKPTMDPYSRPITEKQSPHNPLIGQADLTEAVREKSCREIEKGITEIENILNNTS